MRNDITNEFQICAVNGGFHRVESCDEYHKSVLSVAIVDLFDYKLPQNLLHLRRFKFKCIETITNDLKAIFYHKGLKREE